MTQILDGSIREIQNKIIEVQRIILQKGICDDTIGPCSRHNEQKMWESLGFLRCEKGNNGKDCLFGGYLEKLICTKLWDKIPFYKAITWEYDPDMESFRLVEIIGKPWTTERNQGKISERDFIYSHYKGRMGTITKRESKLLEKFLENEDGIDVETLYRGFKNADEGMVQEKSREAFDSQRGVGLRLDYISGFRKEERAIALMLLFYTKEDFCFGDSVKQNKTLNFPNIYNKENEAIKGLAELAKTISYFATPVIISEIFRRKIYGRTFSLTTKDFL